MSCCPSLSSGLATDSSCGALPAGRVLSPDFFARPASEVAPELIGKVLWRGGVGGGRLSEVEAYLPTGDPACHAWRGRTPRNEAMFGPPGSIYVFLSYGVHRLLNIVCDRESVGAAVLIRSFEPIGDVTNLRRNRGLTGGSTAADLTGPATTVELSRRAAGDGSRGGLVADGLSYGPWLSSGPGRVGQALAIGPALNGLRLGEESGVYILDAFEQRPVGQTTRVGVSRGDSLPLRYYMLGSRYVSELPRNRGGEGI